MLSSESEILIRRWHLFVKSNGAKKHVCVCSYRTNYRLISIGLISTYTSKIHNIHASGPVNIPSLAVTPMAACILSLCTNAMRSHTSREEFCSGVPVSSTRAQV